MNYLFYHFYGQIPTNLFENQKPSYKYLRLIIILYIFYKLSFKNNYFDIFNDRYYIKKFIFYIFIIECRNFILKFISFIVIFILFLFLFLFTIIRVILNYREINV